MKKPAVIVGLIAAILASLGIFLTIHGHPDSKLHLQDACFCLESNDMEDAIAIVKDILLEGIPRYAQLSEGYPAVEVFDKDLFPIYVDTMYEQRTSYHLAIGEDRTVIELFYRNENEAETRFWPGFTIYVLSNCRWENIDRTYGQRVIVFIHDLELDHIVEFALKDKIERQACYVTYETWWS